MRKVATILGVIMGAVYINPRTIRTLKGRPVSLWSSRRDLNPGSLAHTSGAVLVVLGVQPRHKPTGQLWPPYLKFSTSMISLRCWSTTLNSRRFPSGERAMPTASGLGSESTVELSDDLKWKKRNSSFSASAHRYQMPSAVGAQLRS